MITKTLTKTFFSLMIIIGLVSTPANAWTFQSAPKHQDSQMSSAYQGGKAVVYTTSPQDSHDMLQAAVAADTADILLIQTSDPWESSYYYVGNNWYDGITSDTMVLDTLGYSYRIATWNDIDSGAVNIFSYPVILIVNDQVQAFYDEYAAHKTDFETYISNGHTLLFFAAGSGWAGGKLNAPLPGGVTWNLSYIQNDLIVNSPHPIVSAQLSNKVPLINSDLYSNYCNHGWFSNLRTGTQVILKESVSNATHPTLIEYTLGKGRVIASTLTWEHNWHMHTGGDGYGAFARKALDDVFLYALSGGTIPADIKMDLRIEDAPNWISVNKSKGSYLDVVTHVKGDAAYTANVTLQIPGDKFGLPTETFTRNSPNNFGGQSVPYVNLGGGKYQLTNSLQPAVGQPYYEKEFVWRFLIPDGASPEKDIELTSTISIVGHIVQVPASKAKLNIIDYARSIIVTNRKLLFDKYQPNPAENKVSSLLEEVYIQAWAYDGEVFYVDLYNDSTKNWRQNVDYTSETTANVAATTVDGLIDGWYNRLTKKFLVWEVSRPEFLLIVGGDEIIPFYRADDRPYGDQEIRVHVNDNDPVGEVPQQHFLLSDNIYSDVGGDKNDWEKGNLELSTGRIVGHSAESMRQFITNAWLKTPSLSNAVMASMGGSQVNIMLDNLNSRHVDIAGLNNPNMVDNDTWSRDDWLTAWQSTWQLNYYGGHGRYNEIPGPNDPGFTSTITMDQLPVGKIAENHPLFIADACNLAIPSDADGATWKPEENDNVAWKLVDLGIGGIVASEGISNYSGGTDLVYGERLINDYVEYLIEEDNQFSEYWGTALLDAKKNYPSNGNFWTFNDTDKKTMMEYVYYGLPWSFMETPDNQAAQAAIESKLSSGYLVSDNISNEAAGSYSKNITFSVPSYQFTSVDTYEILNIPDANTHYSVYKPILPVLTTTFSLPLGSTVSSISLINEHPINLGNHNIPAADPSTQYNPTTGYTGTMDVTGVYPPSPRYGYDVVDLGDRIEVRIAVAPATFNVDTHEVILYDSTQLQVNYVAPVPVAIGSMDVDKPQYQVGETVTASASIENVSAVPQTLQGDLSIYDSNGNLVGITSSGSFMVGVDDNYVLQIPWTTELQPGGYHAILSVIQGGTPLIASNSSFNVMGGKLSSVSVPKQLFSEYGTFSLSFENYRNAPVSATAKMYIYDALTNEVVSLLERNFTVDANSIGFTSWLWNPTGLPEGQYNVRAVVKIGNEIYMSDIYPLMVIVNTVSTDIGGINKGKYAINSTDTKFVLYPNTLDGPVKVICLHGMPCFTTQVVTSGGSYNELAGYPINQFTTEYWFPYYDHGYPNVAGNKMRTWILVGNPSTTETANVEIRIGGVLKNDPANPSNFFFSIPPGGNVTPRWMGLIGGPVQVKSTNGVNIFASERVFTVPYNSFNEVMGYPVNQFTTEYWFPWYDTTYMDTYLLVGNTSATQTATVDIYLGTTKYGPYNILPNTTLKQRYANKVTGPVRVVATNGVNIVTSEFTLSGTENSFNEVMGYPFDQFDTEYWYPYYDHGYPSVGGNKMRTWILVGNPSNSQTATVQIYMDGVLKNDPDHPANYFFSIPPGGNVTPRWMGSIAGPVRVVSDIPIFTSERVFTVPTNAFNEFMGIPFSQFSTEYWFTWYDTIYMQTRVLISKP